MRTHLSHGIGSADAVSHCELTQKKKKRLTPNNYTRGIRKMMLFCLNFRGRSSRPHLTWEGGQIAIQKREKENKMEKMRWGKVYVVENPFLTMERGPTSLWGS